MAFQEELTDGTNRQSRVLMNHLHAGQYDGVFQADGETTGGNCRAGVCWATEQPLRRPATPITRTTYRAGLRIVVTPRLDETLSGEIEWAWDEVVAVVYMFPRIRVEPT